MSGGFDWISTFYGLGIVGIATTKKRTREQQSIRTCHKARARNISTVQILQTIEESTENIANRD